MSFPLQTPEQLRGRTKDLAVRIVRMLRTLPSSSESRILGNQLLRSATSVAANDRAACRARSRAEFISKLGVALEEADETLFWLELLIDLDLVTRERMGALMDETGQIVKILSAARSTSRKP